MVYSGSGSVAECCIARWRGSMFGFISYEMGIVFDVVADGFIRTDCAHSWMIIPELQLRHEMHERQTPTPAVCLVCKMM